MIHGETIENVNIFSGYRGLTIISEKEPDKNSEGIEE